MNFSEKIRQDESGRRNGFFVEIGRFIIPPLPPSVTAGGGMGREKGGGRREAFPHFASSCGNNERDSAVVRVWRRINDRDWT